MYTYKVAEKKAQHTVYVDQIRKLSSNCIIGYTL